MFPFIYYNPVRILFGQNALEKLDGKWLGEGPVLVLSAGRSFAESGARAAVLAKLAGRDFVEFPGIRPNPHLDQLLDAVALVREKRVGFILACGGGSVIDAAKFIAAAAVHEGSDPWDLVIGKAKIRNALPLGAVLTLPGTGSEHNDGAVISRSSPTDKQAFRNERLYPRFAVLDPAFTLSLPWRQTANGIADAFVHVMEQYATRPDFAPLQNRLAESILATLVETAPLVRARPQDLAVRGEIMWCASLALNRLIGCGVAQDWTTHLIGHAVTAVTGMDHARTLTAILPQLLRDRLESKRARLAQMGRRVFSIAEADDTRAALACIEAIESFFLSLDMPVRLPADECPPSSLPAILEICSRYRFGLGENRDLFLPDLSRILTSSLQ